MDQRKTKAFFEGRDIHAYNIFGAHLEANGVRFRVYAPNAKNISVIGTFNNWDDQASKMKKDKRGIWECFVEGAKDKDSYKYRVWQANGELAIHPSHVFLPIYRRAVFVHASDKSSSFKLS